METVQLSHLTVRRRRGASRPDLSTFFLFFGISGIDQHAGEREQKRFEREYYVHRATVQLSRPLPPGNYHFQGLPEEANRRIWRVDSGSRATTHLSDEGLRELRAWMEGTGRVVVPERTT